MSRRSFSERTWRRDPQFRALCKALAACKTEREVADFLRDVGTLTELKEWSERFEVARRVAKGETYREIMEKTGASTTTVTRVARFLADGEGGYRRSIGTHDRHSRARPAHPRHHHSHHCEETLA